MSEQAEQKLVERWQADPDQAWLPPPRGWQRYTAELHDRLLERWADRLPPGSLVLKTDLFEEARGEDHPLRRIAGRGWQPMGIDVGSRIVAAARERGALAGGPGPVVTDVRRLALADGSIPAIFCNSTLDHFHVARDIDVALRELVRVLAPGGELILTFDNPRNPVVWLRNTLPRRVTDLLGITNYHVGPTLSLRAARRRLRAIGLAIRESGTLMHSLRYRALPRLRRLERDGEDPAAELESLYAAERRSRWPTAQLTGHFIFLVAHKPGGGS
jgi:ubiquinone/menaquinone biosynthesis C-methylase UbiE